MYQADLAAGRRTNASTCHVLWEEVYGGVPPGATAEQVYGGEAGGAYAVRNSIMKAFTQHNPQPCLTRDDVEGIATLYPDCSAQGISQSVCHKARRDIEPRVATQAATPCIRDPTRPQHLQAAALSVSAPR